MSAKEYQNLLATRALSTMQPKNTKAGTQSKNEKRIIQDKAKKQNRLSRLFSSERTRVIKEKIAHFEATGNQRKLAIYRSKL